MPWESWISRVCEEFSCRPSEAVQEWLDAPVGWLEGMIMDRAYARAKHAYDQFSLMDEQARRSLMRQPIFQRVREIEFALAAEEIAARESIDG